MKEQLFIRIKTTSQLEAVREWVRGEETSPVLLLEHELAGMMKQVQTGCGACPVYLCLPDVGRQSRISSIEKMISGLPQGIGLVIRNLDELGMLLKLGFHGPVIGDAFLYAYNSEALTFYLELYPFMQFILSDELTDRELKELTGKAAEDPSEEACGDLAAVSSDRFIYKIYGYQPLMITNQCLNRNYTDCREKKQKFSDSKGGTFTAVSSCSQCSSTIYNGKCTSMLDHREEIGYRNLLIDLTVEDQKETSQILRGKIPEDVTRGHHYKGID